MVTTALEAVNIILEFTNENNEENELIFLIN